MKKHGDRIPADSQEVTAFYIYAKKIKTSVFVMAKYRVLDSLFQKEWCMMKYLLKSTINAQTIVVLSRQKTNDFSTQMCGAVGV